jgi:hypothetical protein
MSSGSERMLEIQFEQFDCKLAKKLGITYDELIELNYEIITDESDDGIIYGYIIKFDSVDTMNILDKVIGIDGDNQVYFDPWEFENDEYYEEQFDAIAGNKYFLKTFQNEIENHLQLNEIILENKDLEILLKRLIFSSIISTLETFLSDTFINLTMDNEYYFKNFVESFPEFRQRKFELKDLYIEQGRIKETGKKVMLDIIYHDLQKVSKMYASTFNIDFPKIGLLMPFILTRHDLVHRNGKTKEGKDVKIDKVSIIELIVKVKTFVEDIAVKLGID